MLPGCCSGDQLPGATLGERRTGEAPRRRLLLCCPPGSATPCSAASSTRPVGGLKQRGLPSTLAGACCMPCSVPPRPAATRVTHFRKKALRQSHPASAVTTEAQQAGAACGPPGRPSRTVLLSGESQQGYVGLHSIEDSHPLPRQNFAAFFCSSCLARGRPCALLAPRRTPRQQPHMSNALPRAPHPDIPSATACTCLPACLPAGGDGAVPTCPQARRPFPGCHVWRAHAAGTLPGGTPLPGNAACCISGATEAAAPAVPAAWLVRRRRPAGQEASRRGCWPTAAQCSPGMHASPAGAANRVHDSAAGAGGRRVAARLAAGPGRCLLPPGSMLGLPRLPAFRGSACGRHARWTCGGCMCACRGCLLVEDHTHVTTRGGCTRCRLAAPTYACAGARRRQSVDTGRADPARGGCG